jgi:hypothetical protein
MYLNFKEIGGQVSFKDLLDWLNFPYKEKNGELKGELKGQVFVVNKEKNLFYLTEEKRGGSIINFLSEFKEIDLRASALEIKKTFLDHKEPKREIPELKLEYCKYLKDLGINEEVCKKYEVGLVTSKTIVSGRVCFKIYDETGEHLGYIGYHPIKDNWYIPQNLKRPLWNYHPSKYAIVTTNPFAALKLISMGLEQSMSIFGANLTEYQENLLLDINTILLVHAEPQNIINRLIHKCYIKSYWTDKPIKDYSVEMMLG